MGLDAGVGSIIQEIPGSEYFDQESYDWQLEVAESINEIAKKFNQDIDFKSRPGKHIINVRIGNYSALHVLRRFAAEIDGWDKEKYRTQQDISKCNDTMNGLYDYDYYLRKSKFKHLIDHSDCEGYYLPFDFETPGVTNDKNHSIGSSVRLKHELEEIMDAINETNNLEIETIWDRIYELACLSVQHQLPIEFY